MMSFLSSSVAGISVISVKRLSIMVGGELNLNHLELRYEEVARVEALQMKANGGMFLIDDFGRRRYHLQNC